MRPDRRGITSAAPNANAQSRVTSQHVTGRSARWRQPLHRTYRRHRHRRRSPDAPESAEFANSKFFSETKSPNHRTTRRLRPSGRCDASVLRVRLSLAAACAPVTVPFVVLTAARAAASLPSFAHFSFSHPSAAAVCAAAPLAPARARHTHCQPPRRRADAPHRRPSRGCRGRARETPSARRYPFTLVCV